MSDHIKALKGLLKNARACTRMSDGEYAAIGWAIDEIKLHDEAEAEAKARDAQPFPGECDLPNGCTLHWRDNGAGGREYYSDEVGGGVFVWDTCLVSRDTLLAAIVNEAGLRYAEETAKRKEARS